MSVRNIKSPKLGKQTSGVLDTHERTIIWSAFREKNNILFWMLQHQNTHCQPETSFPEFLHLRLNFSHTSAIKKNTLHSQEKDRISVF